MSKLQLAQDMLALTLQNREEYAAKLFNLSDVKMRIKAAALEGQSHVRVPQNCAHDLELTDAALKLTAWMEKHGFRCRWFPVSIPEKIHGQPTGRELGYRQLVIDWAGEFTWNGTTEFLPSELEGTVECDQ